MKNEAKSAPAIPFDPTKGITTFIMPDSMDDLFASIEPEPAAPPKKKKGETKRTHANRVAADLQAATTKQAEQEPEKPKAVEEAKEPSTEKPKEGGEPAKPDAAAPEEQKSAAKPVNSPEEVEEIKEGGAAPDVEMKTEQDKDDHKSDAKSEKSEKNNDSSSDFNESDGSAGKIELMAKLAKMKTLLAQKKMDTGAYKEQVMREAEREKRRQEK